MKFSIKTGPMVGEHVENCRTNNTQAAIKALRNLGVIEHLLVSRLTRLNPDETLRFDTLENTGVSVTKITSD